MKCPVCAVDLLMNERQGIEIDYCPKCRGIWLDRGELDKILERERASAPVGRPYEGEGRRDDRHYDRGYHDEHQHEDRHYDKHGRHKHRSIFDIFD